MQIALQLLLALTFAQGGDANMGQIYFSIVLSIISISSNIVRILRGARKSKSSILQYIVEILQVGVGHIPYIAGIRDGHLTEADFSSVPGELLMEEDGYGLRRIFEAMEDGRSLERVAFSDGVMHDLGDFIDFEAGQNGIKILQLLRSL